MSLHLVLQAIECVFDIDDHNLTNVVFIDDTKIFHGQLRAMQTYAQVFYLLAFQYLAIWSLFDTLWGCLIIRILYSLKDGEYIQRGDNQQKQEEEFVMSDKESEFPSMRIMNGDYNETEQNDLDINKIAEEKIETNRYFSDRPGFNGEDLENLEMKRCDSVICNNHQSQGDKESKGGSGKKEKFDSVDSGGFQIVMKQVSEEDFGQEMEQEKNYE